MFKSLGVCDELCSSIEKMGWTKPTPVQAQSLPIAFKGHDVIAIAETGSGKTGAFAIPILQSLLKDRKHLYAVILAPTRELSLQIADALKNLGSSICLRICILIGGENIVSQTLSLADKPHIIVASPGRLVDHMENTRGFNLKEIKYLVLDEADKLLSLDFEVAIDKILRNIPKQRQTFLFSATMTSQVNKLKRAALRNPVEVSVSSKNQTSSTLFEKVAIVPLKYKDSYLFTLLRHLSTYKIIIFFNTCQKTVLMELIGNHMGLKGIALHGKMKQKDRTDALDSFRAGKKYILYTTDVGSRGLDINDIGVVINYDIPNGTKDYIHRVGRTARAGKEGTSITIVTQYDIIDFHNIENILGYKLETYNEIPKKKYEKLLEKIEETERLAKIELKEAAEMKKRKERKKKR